MTTMSTNEIPTTSVTNPGTVYRCTECAKTTSGDYDADIGIDFCPRCWTMLFDTDIVSLGRPAHTGPARKARKARRVERRFTYKLISDGYRLEAGDQRDYDVSMYGRHIGMVSQCPLPGPVVDGPLIDGFSFRSADGKLVGDGRTRAEAIIASGITTPIK